MLPVVSRDPVAAKRDLHSSTEAFAYWSYCCCDQSALGRKGGERDKEREGKEGGRRGGREEGFTWLIVSEDLSTVFPRHVLG